MYKTQINYEKLVQLRNLPAILAGKAKDPDGLRRVFVTAFVHSIMTSVQAAFLAKSAGGTDDLGNEWEPLSASRLKQKSSEWYLRQHPYAIPNAILRETDKLLKSYGAGTFDTLNYFPPKNQVVEFHAGMIKIYSEVEYAPAQASRRPIIPDDIGPWIDRAITAGLQALTNAIKYLA